MGADRRDASMKFLRQLEISSRLNRFNQDIGTVRPRRPASAATVRLVIGWLTLFWVGTDLFIISPLLPTMARHFVVSPSTAGWAVTVFALAYALGSPLWGSRADHVGKRAVIIFGLIGFSAGNFLTSQVSTFGLFLGTRMISGVSTAAVVPAIYAIIGDIAPVAHRGRWLSLVGSGLLMSLWVGAPLGTVIAHAVGWQSIFVGLSLGATLLVFANGVVWPAGAVHAKASPSQILVTVAIPWRRLLVDVAITGGWALAVYGFYTYIGTGLDRLDHLSTERVTIILVAYGIGATVGSLTGGRLADRFGSQRVATIGLFGLGGLLVLIGYFFRMSWLLYGLMGCFAVLAYAFFPAFQSFLAARYPDRRGLIMAWNNAALYSGIALGAWIGGQVIMRWPFSVLPIMCGMLALLVGLVTLRQHT